MYFVNIIYKTFVSFKKNKVKRGNTHLDPKRCQVHCLGLFSLWLPSLSHILLIISIKHLLVLKNMEKKKKNSCMVWMMCLPPFGPVFVGTALSVIHFVNRIYKTLVSIRKHKKRSSPRSFQPFFVAFPDFVTFTLPFTLVFIILVGIQVVAIIGAIKWSQWCQDCI